MFRLLLGYTLVAFCLFNSDSASAARGGRTHVYLLRGIADVSVGLDVLAAKLAGRGIAASVHSHGDAALVAGKAIGDYKSGRLGSIILIGHSLGAGAILSTARQLDDAGVPVMLLIALDPVWSGTVSPNVKRAVNFYVSGSGVALGTAPAFRANLRNVDVSGPGMNHMAVQATNQMHNRIIGLVRTVGARRRTTPLGDKK